MPPSTIWALRLTEAVLTAARRHWALGDVPVTLIAARENQVFRVDLPGGPAALRLHRPGYRTTAELRSELDWMAMLARSGIAVPAPIPAPDGTSLLVTQGVAVDLLSWLEGAPLSASRPDAQTYFALGVLIARMQECADGWIPPPGFTRLNWDLVGDDPTWGRFWENPALTPDQGRLFTEFRDYSRGALDTITTADTGLIHADLVPDNVMLHAGELHPIDFDDGGFGPRLFDLATVTFRSRRTDPTGALARATIDGYTSQRDADMALLPLFEALRACTYVGWNITRMAENGGHERNTCFITAALAAIESLAR